MTEPSTRVGDVIITLRQTRFWRDWMPEVEAPGPDGGSPLYADLHLELENTGDHAATLQFEAVLHRADETTTPISLEITASGDTSGWRGPLGAGERRLISLSGRRGPYVPAGEPFRCELRWRDHSAHTGSVMTGEQRILRVD